MKRVRSSVPSFYKRDTVGEIRAVNYQAIEGEAVALRTKLDIAPSARDDLRIALMPIDTQIGFCVPGQPLFVGGRSGTGAVDDTARTCEFVYREARRITDIFPTMDTHFPFQIFHPTFLVDDAGNHPAPFSQITLDEITAGKWKFDPKAAYAISGKSNTAMALQAHLRHYAESLSRGGRYSLTVWPYHTMLGGVDHALVPALQEAIFFHSLLRYSQPKPQIKGGNPLTENYSIFKPEVLEGADRRPIAQRNTNFIEMLLAYDVVVICGQAKSHCVPWSIDDLLTEINVKDPALVCKVYILDDCSSAVVVPGVIDLTDPADEAYRRFAAAGMHVVNSTTPIEEWPGIDGARLAA